LSLSRKNRRQIAAAHINDFAHRPAHSSSGWPGFLIAALIIIFAATHSGCGHKTGTEVTTTTGLKYVDEVIGTGDKPKLGKTVVVHYTGTFTDGTKFESSLDRGQPYEFRIGTGSVVRGWDEGILSMRVGGKRKLIVPPDLGYGSQGKGKIPPNTTLIFEIELLGVK